MPSPRDIERKRKRQRKVDALAAAAELLPVVMRSLLRAGLTPDALQAVVDQALADSREGSTPSFDERKSRQDLDDLAHVLSVWHADPRFMDGNGHPRGLRQEGRAPSFQSLAQAAIPSLSAAEALRRLLIAGVVDVDARGHVRALRRELVTSEWDELGFWNWRNSVKRYLETLEFNYTVAGEGRFERTARSERLSVSSLPVFNRWAREQGANFVQVVDDWLTQHEGPIHADNGDDVISAGIGVYLFVDEPDGGP